MKHFLAGSQRNPLKGIKYKGMPWTCSSLLYLHNDTEENKICTSLLSSLRLKTLVRWLHNSLLQDGWCVLSLQACLSVTWEQILLKNSICGQSPKGLGQSLIAHMRRGWENGFKSSLCLPNPVLSRAPCVIREPQGPGFHVIVLPRTSMGSICNPAHPHLVYPLY